MPRDLLDPRPSGGSSGGRREAVECLGVCLASDDARRAHFREKLRDPEFRGIDGLPLDGDEEVLAMSAPRSPSFFPDDLTRARQASGTVPEQTERHRRGSFAVAVTEARRTRSGNAAMIERA